MEHCLCCISVLAILSSGAQSSRFSLVRMTSPTSTSVSMETENTVTPFAPTDTTMDTPAFTGTTVDTPGFTETTVDTPALTETTVDTPGFTETTVDTPALTETTVDTPALTGTTVDTPALTGTTVDTPGFTETTVDTPALTGTTTDSPTETIGPTDANTDLPVVTETTADPPTTAKNTMVPSDPTTADPLFTTESTMDPPSSLEPTEAPGSTVVPPDGVTEHLQSSLGTTTTPNESPTTIRYTTVNLTPESTNDTDLTNATQGTPFTTLTTTLSYSHTMPDMITDGTSPTHPTTQILTLSPQNPTTITTNTSTNTTTASTLAPTPTTPSSPTPIPTTPSTPTPIPTTTSTPAPLVCANGGTALGSMVCICPDEWTGPTCSLQNFCKAAKVEEFQFPRTLVGFFAYSERRCPAGTSGAGKPQASTRCLPKGPVPGFGPVRVFQCEQTLSDILQNLTSGADLELLASSTQILTSQPEEMKSENITAAAQIANTLLQSPNATEGVRAAAMATVSQLMSAPVNTEENNATQSLTQTLDNLSVNLSRSHNTSQVVQPNLVVQSAHVLDGDSQGIQFTSLAGTSGNFSANRLQLNTNAPDVVVENGTTVEALVYLRFRSGQPTGGSTQTVSNISMGFVLYQNNRFFTSKRFRGRQATIRVLSATVRGEERSITPEHVELQFRPAVPEGFLLHDFSCVFWNYSLLDWSTTGCSKREASDGVLRCFCNHTTNFAALWSYREDFKYAEALNIVSIVGLSFSILGLVVTILHHIRENFLRTPRKQTTSVNSRLALLFIYVSLLAFIITFIAGVQNQPRNTEPEDVDDNVIPDSEEHVWPDRGPCTAVAALQHFFLLATFSWNSVYGTQLVLLVRSMRRSLPPFWKPLSVAVGWGFPAVLTAVTLAVTYRADSPLGYRQEEFCWLAGLEKDRFSFRKPLFWGFLLPVGLILIYNMVLLLLTSLITCRDSNLRSSRHSSSTSKVLVSVSLAVLLGLSWTLGYLVLVPTGPAKTTFSILFCICTTTQGFQIFIFFTARTPTFKNAVRRSLRFVTAARHSLNSTKYHLWKNLRESFTTETYRDVKEGTTSL
ncbi:adhesion G-protein coupled receptor G7 isoform X2 [Oryzias latipes]|uniref:Adhesion G protein-coupled receptor G7 n=1 Tax=Oryzias latipes TaxID=8090 RepID=A0A3B3I1M7_ORYLA|nr:adhesion G-protein coupled receptor G7 isoform X2 [Oryzias latipes]